MSSGLHLGCYTNMRSGKKIVIHRNVKSSNILIDGDMNLRLGDFGLARFYDHGKISHDKCGGNDKLHRTRTDSNWQGLNKNRCFCIWDFAPRVGMWEGTYSF